MNQEKSNSTGRQHRQLYENKYKSASLRRHNINIFRYILMLHFYVILQYINNI